MDATLLKAFFTLAAVVAVLAVVLVVVRRYAAGQISAKSGAQFRIIGQIALQPKKQVYLLLVADRLLVVGAADQGMTTLAEITDPEAIAALVEARTAPVTSRFPLFSSQSPLPGEEAASAPPNGILSFSQFLKALGKKESFLRDLR